MRTRNHEINKRRQRRAKLKKLKHQLAETKDIKKRDELIQKIRKYEYQFEPE